VDGQDLGSQVAQFFAPLLTLQFALAVAFQLLLVAGVVAIPYVLGKAASAALSFRWKRAARLTCALCVLLCGVAGVGWATFASLGALETTVAVHPPQAPSPSPASRASR
jgi:hypothetical protein